MPVRTPHPANVAGDFYVEHGCCLSCNMPFTVAPDLFASTDGELDGQCYIRRQPLSADEVDRMVKAFQVQDVGCIRYKGTNPIIQLRLIESGEGEQCDSLSSELSEKLRAMKSRTQE